MIIESEYAALRIAEYRIVNLERAQVTILALMDGLYEAARCQGEDCLHSQMLPILELTVKQVLQANEA